MPEIGPTLREARMRAKIDITEVEQATKIRAKYLRALENEEWGLLPGPTFIKSFLREYAAYLGIDGRTLVEEYKLRYERPSEQELAPLSPNKLGRDRRGSGGGAIGAPRTAPRWAIVGGVLVLVVVVLGLVGSLGGGGSGGSSTTTGTSASGTAHRAADRAATRRHPAHRAAPARASVVIVPTGTVYVCLVDGGGRVLIPGSQFTAGQQVPTFSARKLRITLGNNAVKLRVNGRALAVPASSAAIAYEITPAGARPLPTAQAPTCTG